MSFWIRAAATTVLLSATAGLIPGDGGSDFRVALAQAPPGPEALPAPPGLYSRVPHGSGSLYVPLDSSGRPLAPPGIPMEPSPPSPPAVPGAPSQPSWSDWGYLRIEAEPSDARVFIDGRDLGPARQLAGPEQFVALTPGLRRIDLRLPGFRPASTVVEIAPRRAHLLRLQLVPDPGAPAAQPGSRPGDDVTGEATPAGGGYFVVPRR